MSHLAPLMQRISSNHLYMADLAELACDILKYYDAQYATFRRLEVRADEIGELHYKAAYSYDLPIHSSSGTPNTKDWNSYKIGNAIDVIGIDVDSEIKSAVRTLLQSKILDDSSLPKAGHYARWDRSSGYWLHFIFLRRPPPSARRRAFDIVFVAEPKGQSRARYRIISGTNSSEGLINKLEARFDQFTSFGERDADIIDGVTRIAPSDDTDAVILLANLFDQKFRLNSFVSQKLVDQCWVDALKTGRRNTNLPWELGPNPGASVHTTTVSVDLRKSTSLMEQAESREAFAIWLETLSEICRRIVHDNEGIFDKFTGDGVIAHFVATRAEDSECNPPDDTADQMREENLRKSTLQAFKCGCELIRALNIHIEALRPSLRYNIGATGATVGMAHGEASWSLDRDGRPVVVGRGVVDACRLTSGKAGWLLLANNLKHRLAGACAPDLLDELRPFTLTEHKDLQASVRPGCFVLQSMKLAPGRDRTALRALVSEISEQVATEHRERVALLLG